MSSDHWCTPPVSSRPGLHGLHPVLELVSCRAGDTAAQRSLHLLMTMATCIFFDITEIVQRQKASFDNLLEEIHWLAEHKEALPGSTGIQMLGAPPSCPVSPLNSIKTGTHTANVLPFRKQQGCTRDASRRAFMRSAGSPDTYQEHRPWTCDNGAKMKHQMASAPSPRLMCQQAQKLA